MEIQRIDHDITVLRNQMPAPGIGVVPINSYVLHAAEPVVIDTGLPDRGFLDVLGSVVDPIDVRWIWLTHPDRNHTGGLFDLLEAAPRARLVSEVPRHNRAAAPHGSGDHSEHSPAPASGRLPEFVEMLAAAPMGEPFVGPDQQALEAMLAGFEPGANPNGRTQRVARRPAARGWRAAVLDERASRHAFGLRASEEAAADKRQP
jgi:glyoxylase-like metal-dependent hydrolase (beta-lactamase superfamily II)